MIAAHGQRHRRQARVRERQARAGVARRPFRQEGGPSRRRARRRRTRRPTRPRAPRGAPPCCPGRRVVGRSQQRGRLRPVERAVVREALRVALFKLRIHQATVPLREACEVVQQRRGHRTHRALEAGVPQARERLGELTFGLGRAHCIAERLEDHKLARRHPAVGVRLLPVVVDIARHVPQRVTVLREGADDVDGGENKARRRRAARAPASARGPRRRRKPRADR